MEQKREHPQPSHMPQWMIPGLHDTLLTAGRETIQHKHLSIQFSQKLYNTRSSYDGNVIRATMKPSLTCCSFHHIATLHSLTPPTQQIRSPIHLTTDALVNSLTVNRRVDLTRKPCDLTLLFFTLSSLPSTNLTHPAVHLDGCCCQGP